MTSTPADLDAYRLWQTEYHLIDTVLTRIETRECEILAALQCPTNPVAVYRILAREDCAPWPTRTAARDRQRALHAMHVLVKIRETRGHLALGHENSRLAAYAALYVGLLANDAAINAALGIKVRQQTRSAGSVGGTRKSAPARTHDAAIRKHATLWKISENLQDEYRSMAGYVQRQTRLPRRTIDRRITALKLRQ